MVAPPYDILSDRGSTGALPEEPLQHHPHRPRASWRKTASGCTEDWHGRAGELFRSVAGPGDPRRRDRSLPITSCGSATPCPTAPAKSWWASSAAAGSAPLPTAKSSRTSTPLPSPRRIDCRLMRTTAANISQIYAFYSDPEKRVRPAPGAGPWRRRPLSRPWTTKGKSTTCGSSRTAGLIGAIQAVFAERPLFIADGHHRYETAVAYKEERGRPRASAVAGWNYVMMFAANLDEGGITVLPTHRLIRAARAFREPMRSRRRWASGTASRRAA